LPGDDSAAGISAPREHAHHDPAAERVTAEVVLASAEPEVLDEGEPVVGEHVGRVQLRIVRSRALPMAAEIGQDKAEPLLGERAGRAPVEPVRSRAHKSVQQNQRPTRPGLAVGQLRAVMAGESRNVHSVPILDEVAAVRLAHGASAAWQATCP
jgi:hypothetical protein